MTCAFCTCTHFNSNHACKNQMPGHGAINRTRKRVITWDYVRDCTDHGLDGELTLTKMHGEHNLTPSYDVKGGASDWLSPELLFSGLSMYKITHDERFLNYSRSAADSIERYMLNEKGIVRIYSYRYGASDRDPTSLNFYVLPGLAELAVYDPAYKSLVQKVGEGIIHYGLSKNSIPYDSVYPNGTAACTINGIASNGDTGAVSLVVIGLLRAYQATGNTVFLNKCRDILIAVWIKEKTKCNLIPTQYDSVKLTIVNSNTQLYATGELLDAYIYYYYLTHDPEIRDIISTYSEAAYKAYWCKTRDGNGYFVYRVDVNTGKPSVNLLETNWHKLDMSLIYAGEATGKDYRERAYEDMNTYWLGRGLAYRNHLFRHGTYPNGCPFRNKQSLIYAGLRTSIYMMLRMLNDGSFQPTDQDWNEKIWSHVEALRTNHYQEYGYHTDIDVDTLKPDPNYYGLGVESACGEFSSLVTLMFNTTPNVKMAWETFPEGDFVLEPFSPLYSDEDLGFMRNVFMDYSHREVAFKEVVSKGEGKIYCTEKLKEVKRDGQTYSDWNDNSINLSDGKHEYEMVFDGGHYVSPKYP